MTSPSSVLTRRRFLRQSCAFSALAAFGSFSVRADSPDSDPGAAHLLMLGDWGDDGPSAQAIVASAMDQYTKQHALVVQALLLLGDNWYGDLDGGVQSPRWQSQFEKMYPADVFACPAYAIGGNHDYQRWPDSKVAAELEYARVGRTSMGPTRWTMPSLWYRFDFPLINPLITFLALDSNMPFTDGSSNSGRDFTLTPRQQTEQLSWLEAELGRSRTTPFLAVMAHHPVYSDGPHGDHKVLIRDWDPLFRRHNVDLYLAGHDHDLQHLEFEGHPTSFFLSGGGGADLYDLRTDPKERGPFGQKVHGFSHLSVTDEQMTLRHIDSDGRTLHGFTKTPRGKVVILGEPLGSIGHPPGQP
jgi:tartrate-resistant acid phosphatase type 5